MSAPHPASVLVPRLLTLDELASAMLREASANRNQPPVYNPALHALSARAVQMLMMEVRS